MSSAPVRVIPSVLGCITSPKLPPELDLEHELVWRTMQDSLLPMRADLARLRADLAQA